MCLMGLFVLDLGSKQPLDSQFGNFGQLDGICPYQGRECGHNLTVLFLTVYAPVAAQ
jgi:hypothetical protein